MTFSAPLTEVALQALHDAEPGAFMRLDAAALLDLQRLRSMSFGERLAELDQVLMLAEKLASPSAVHEAIRSGPMRL